MDRHDKQTDRQTDRQSDRQVDRQNKMPLVRMMLDKLFSIDRQKTADSCFVALANFYIFHCVSPRVLLFVSCDWMSIFTGL